MNSITKRWIKGSLLTIIVLLFLAESFMIISIRNSYYSSAQTALTNRINTIYGTLNATGKISDSEREKLLFTLTSEFAEKDKFELMLLGYEGEIIATSSGFTPEDSVNTEDFKNASESTEDIYVNTYYSPVGENIMSATYILESPTQEVCAIRIITSLSLVDDEINIIVAFAVIAAIAIISFSIVSGSFFIKSIVNPINSIKDTADKISKGDFNVRIKENKNYSQEIGQLCQSINHMAEELGKNEGLKNEFISSISHELRTPLTAIKGWAETMDETEDIDTLKKGTQIILNESGRLYSMVENLLDFSRMQNSTFTLTKEKLDIVAEVYDAVIMYTPQAEKAGITLNFTEPESVIPVMADKGKIKQVMINLLDNALKYSNPGSKIDIKIIYKRDKSAVTVQVKDYGKGIMPEDIEKVKEKFYKGKGAKRGSGIGLALVNEIIKMHGGEFDIKSEYKKYTVMSFTLKTVRTMKGK